LNIRTIHRRKIQEILESANILSTFRWLPADEGRGVFSLAAVVTNLRWTRRKPTTVEQLLVFVRADQNVRDERGMIGRPDISVRDAGVLGKEFIGVLSFEELPRWYEVRSKVLHGWLMVSSLNSPLPDIDALAIHPSVARFILSGENDELPDTKSEWAKWAFDAVMINCEPQLMDEAA